MKPFILFSNLILASCVMAPGICPGAEPAAGKEKNAAAQAEKNSAQAGARHKRRPSTASRSANGPRR